MSIFSRIRSMKQNLGGQNAARTLVLDRPLTSEECKLAEHLLRYAGVPGQRHLFLNSPMLA
jgi:hypothetical protein